jgi:thymidylate synthase (FAD)
VILLGAKNLQVVLIRYTPEPQELVAMGAKLCYSAAAIGEIQQGIERRDQATFLDKLVAAGHLSPIEHACFTFGVEGVSRSLLAQITRHRIASFSVKSQRYVSEATAAREDEVFNYIIPPRIQEMGPDLVAEFEKQMEQIQSWYDFWLKKLGNRGEQSNEDARFVLPNAAETKMLVTMNARELLHFFSVRCCNRAQWEIRSLATEMLRQVREVAPVLFRDAGPACLKGTCPEGAMSCGRSAEVREKFSAL